MPEQLPRTPAAVSSAWANSVDLTASSLTLRFPWQLTQDNWLCESCSNRSAYKQKKGQMKAKIPVMVETKRRVGTFWFLSGQRKIEHMIVHL